MTTDCAATAASRSENGLAAGFYRDHHAALKAIPIIMVKISYNEALSLKRANSVADAQAEGGQYPAQ